MKIYWFDYIFILLILLIVSIFKIGAKYSKFYIKITKEIFLFHPLLYTNQIILDILFTIQLLIKLKNIKIRRQVSNIIISIYNSCYYFLKQFIIIIIEGSIILYLKKINQLSDNNLIFKSIGIIQAFLILFCIMMTFILSKNYKNFINYKKSFDFNNNIEQKKYEKNRQEIIMAIEHFMYKNICDIILNIPSILFHSNITFINNFKNYIEYIENNKSAEYKRYYFDIYYYFNSFFGLFYLYLFGIMLLNIDYINDGFIEKILNFLFCVKKYHFYFGNGKNNKYMKNLYDKDIKIDKLNYNSYFKDDSDYEDIEPIVNETFSESTNNIESSSENSIIEEKKKEETIQNNALKYEYSPCNFFIIYKLLNLYFKTNKNFFQELENNEENNISKINATINNKNEIIDSSQSMSSLRSFSEEGNKIRGHIRNKSFQNRNMGKALNVNVRKVNNVKEKLINVSKISLSNKKKLVTSKKYSLEELSSNIEEQKMKKYFIKHIYKNLNNNNGHINISKSISTIREKDESIFNSFSETDIINKTKTRKTNFNMDKDAIFSIKSLTNDCFFDINPYYNITIKDIIKSLDISNNMELFDKFSEEKMKNESYNNYYTKDILLNIEIYDELSLNNFQLKTFIFDYKNYLLDKITNFSYTFLPLIIGIFNIKYLSYNKIIVVSRNPLTFSYNINFNFWLKLIIAGTDRIIETSTDKEDLINLDEIELSNNISLEDNEYKNSIEILDNDLSFLQNSLKFNMNFKINLFILNDEYKNDLFNVGQNDASSINQNTNDINESKGLETIMRESLVSFPYDEYKKFNFHKKYFDSDDICLLEKLYVNELVNNRYIFKIYFTDIFKKRIVYENVKEKNIDIKINPEISYSSSFINDEDEEEKENIIKQNNAKYCGVLKNRLIKNINKASNFDEIN